MFSIQFCVCFYSILYICQSHFTVNINKNVTKKDEIKKQTTLDTKNTSDEAIIPKNNTTVENLTENVSKIYRGIDKRRKTVERNKSIDNIDESLLKKNHNISGINLTQNDSSYIDKQQIVTEKIVNKPADYLNSTIKNDITTNILQTNVNVTKISQMNITKKDEIKMKTNLDTKNTSDEAIIPKNNTTVENLTENVSKIFRGIDNRHKTVERNKSIDNIDESLLKKNHNISGINLTLNDLSCTDKQQIVTENIVNKPADYLDNKTVTVTVKTKFIEGARVEEQNTTVKNDITTKILQNNDNLTMIPKNNVDMTKMFQNNCNVTKISQMNVAKKDEIKMRTNLDTKRTSDEAIIPKNNTTVENLTENVSKIYRGRDKRRKTVKRNKSIDNIDESLLKKNHNISGINLTLNDSSCTDKQQIVTEEIVDKPADYLENQTVTFTVTVKIKLIECARVEEQNTTVKNDITTKILQNNNNLTNISQINDNITENFQNNNDTLKIAEENEFFMNVESINMTKKSKNNDSSKNLKKRGIGMPEQVSNDYNPQDFQNHDARDYKNYDLNKNIENYDIPENIQQYDLRNIAQKHAMSKEVHNTNDYKPYYKNYEIKYKNMIEKTAVRQKDEHTRFNDDSLKIIPQIQTRLNNDLVKKRFDEFKMVRRITHFTMPDIPIQNDISNRKIERYQDIYDSKFQEYYSDGIDLNYYAKDSPKNILYPRDQEINHKINPVYEEVEPMPNNFRQLNKLLSKQKAIIRKLTQLQLGGPQQAGKDFEKLLEKVKEKQNWRNYTKFEFTKRTTTKSTTASTAKPATVLTLFDETEVRTALKNDPNVRRLLKIGNLKRERYLKKVKKYLERKNYTDQEA